MIIISNFLKNDGIKWAKAVLEEAKQNRPFAKEIQNLIKEFLPNKIEVKFKKLTPSAHIPTKAHTTDAGFDLYADRVDYEGSKYIYHTSIAMEIPKGYVGLIYPRSSICKVDAIMTNHVGVIDSGYRGDIMLTFKNYNSPQATVNFKPYKIGERIGQIIIIPYPEIEFIEVDELSESDRGEGGHGSSGK